jgi:hypothetical protein
MCTVSSYMIKLVKLTPLNLILSQIQGVDDFSKEVMCF